MKKIAADIKQLINRLTGNLTIHSKCSFIKGSYSAGRRDGYNSDYDGKFPVKS